MKKSNLDSQLQATISENKNLISALELKTKTVAQLETKLLRYSTKIKTLQADIIVLRNSNQSKTHHEQSLQADLQNCQLKLYETASTATDGYQFLVTTTNTEYTKLNEELTRKNSKLRENFKTVSALQTQVADLQKEIHQLEKSQKELVKKSNKNELKLKSSDHSTLEKAHKNLRNPN